MKQAKFILLSKKQLSEQVVRETKQVVERFCQIKKARFLLIDGTEYDVIPIRANGKEVSNG